MKTSTVFHINEGKIKFLQMANGHKKLVTALDVLDIAQQGDEAIIQTLVSFLKQKKINFNNGQVSIVVPRSWVILRLLHLPSHQEDEIRSMIDLQIGEYIPYAREDVELDFQILSKTPDGYSKVAVVIIPQEIAMRYWTIFNQAKIPVHRMTISSVGLWLWYQQQPGLSDKPAAVFDLDMNSSEICLCCKTHMMASREIPIGFDQIQKDGYEEILKQWELTQNTISDKVFEKNTSVYLMMTTDKNSGLSNELKRLNEGLLVKEIYLTKELTLKKGLQWPQAIIEEGISLAALAGIACCSMNIPVDLVPKSIKESKNKRLLKRQLIVLSIWFTTGLISLGFALGMGYFKKNMELARLEEALAETKHESASVKKQLQKIHDIEDIIKKRLIFSNLVEKITPLLAPEMYLVNISISEKNTLSFQGLTQKSTAINQFQSDLVNTHDFSDVKLEYVNKRMTQQGEIDYFKMTCIINSSGDKNEKT
ncbi:MAG: pilus assembly protein PilM [Candidatus Omnitrophica bacterium]|nr:pilus assembly protein PilM [Candidatus Omnitrophota bacterium]